MNLFFNCLVRCECLWEWLNRFFLVVDVGLCIVWLLYRRIKMSNGCLLVIWFIIVFYWLVMWIRFGNECERIWIFFLLISYWDCFKWIYKLIRLMSVCVKYFVLWWINNFYLICKCGGVGGMKIMILLLKVWRCCLFYINFERLI